MASFLLLTEKLRLEAFMKFSLLIGLTFLSLSSFAYVVHTPDLGDTSNLAEEIKAASKKTFIISENLFPSYQGYYYNKVYNIKHPGYQSNCYRYDPLSKEIRELVLKTPVEEFQYDYNYSRKKHFVMVKDRYLMLCEGIYSTELSKSFSSLFKTKVESAAEIDGVKVNIVAVTEEENPDVLIEKDGVEELVSADVVLFDHARNGFIQTRGTAVLEDMKTVVKVLQVGTKLAKVSKNEKESQIVKIQNIIGIGLGHIEENTPVYIKDIGAGKVLGGTRINDEYKVVIDTTEGIKLIEKDDVETITKSSRFNNKEIYVKVGNKKLKAKVLGATSLNDDALVIVERGGKVEAYSPDKVIAVSR